MQDMQIPDRGRVDWCTLFPLRRGSCSRRPQGVRSTQDDHNPQADGTVHRRCRVPRHAGLRRWRFGMEHRRISLTLGCLVLMGSWGSSVALVVSGAMWQSPCPSVGSVCQLFSTDDVGLTSQICSRRSLLHFSLAGPVWTKSFHLRKSAAWAVKTPAWCSIARWACEWECVQ